MVAKATPITAGEVFGRLTTETDAYRKGKYLYVDVLCSCGKRKAVEQSSLRRGASLSCGCLSKELTAERSTTHGKRADPIYAVWNAMLGRCHNPSNVQYKDYGGRGITVCPEWRTFPGFYADMGDPPFEGAMLERSENDLGYSKDNCVWATREEQNNNQRKNVRYEFNGKTQTLRQWARELDLNFATLSSRIYSYGWSIEKTLTTPIKSR